MGFSSEEKFVESSDGTVIFARAVGDPNKASLVFVHGMSLSGVVFDDLFQDETLLNRFYLVSYDIRSHGRSGKPADTPENHTSKLYADDFASVVEAFKLKKPIFVGWSFGATIISDICAHLEPGCISGAVCVGGPPSAGVEASDVGTPLLPELMPGLLSNDATLSVKSKAGIIDAIFNDPQSVPVTTKWLWLGISVQQSALGFQMAVSRVQDKEKLIEAGRKGLPLLVLHGTMDKLMNGKGVVNFTKPIFKDLEVHMVEGGSHAPFYENKDEFVRVLVAFATRVGK